MNLRPKAARTLLLPLAGEGGPQGRKREETARFKSAIHGSRLQPGGLSSQEKGDRNFFSRLFRASLGSPDTATYNI